MTSTGTGVMISRVAKASPRLKARLAGALYLLSVATAVFGEAFAHGTLSYAAGFVAVACYAVVTLLLYAIFKPVSRSLSSIAALLNLINLTFEGFRFSPWGVDVALGFYGTHCLLIGYLALRSSFLPRALGPLMAIGGAAWLTLLSPKLASTLSPYNLAAGFLGVGSLMLWLIFFAVDVQRWTEQSDAMG